MSLLGDIVALKMDGTPPETVRKIEIGMLMQAFANAFGVEPIPVEDLSADQALSTFREFTAACMETVPVDTPAFETYRTRLRAEAYKLGSKGRDYLSLKPKKVFKAVRYGYRGIGIEIEGELPGTIHFTACSFAQRYTPADCRLMSGFDEGFICGVAGYPEGSLEFSCRLTEGTAECTACLRDGRDN